MTTIGDTPPRQSVSDEAVAELDRAYVAVRRTYADALSLATTEAEQHAWQARTTRMRRHRELVNDDQLSEVLDAIAAIRGEHNLATRLVADQIARAQVRAFG